VLVAEAEPVVAALEAHQERQRGRQLAAVPVGQRVLLQRRADQVLTGRGEVAGAEVAEVAEQQDEADADPVGPVSPPNGAGGFGPCTRSPWAPRPPYAASTRRRRPAPSRWADRRPIAPRCRWPGS